LERSEVVVVSSKPMRTAAIIGCGRGWVAGKEGFGIANAHADGWRAEDPTIRLLAVDVDPMNLSAFGDRYEIPPGDRFASTDALYEAHTPDFVSVCTWPGLHAPMVVEAAERGVRGIVCEKPAALDAREIRRMLATCEERQVRLAIAHQRRHNAYFERARRLLSEGVLGDGLVLEARVGHDWDILSWTTHWFDLASYLFDAAPEWVLAGLDHVGERRYGHAVERASIVLAQYPQGRQAIFITGPENPQPVPLTIRGTRGLARVSERQPIQVLSDTGYHELVPSDADHRGCTGEFQCLIRELIDAVDNGAAMRCDAAATALATEVALAAHESARTMRRVSLPLETLFAPLEVVQRPVVPGTWGARTLLHADEHFGGGGREGIAGALKELTGHDAIVVDAAKHGLGGVELHDVDIICLYHTVRAADEETQRVLTDWVEAGRPLLVVHAALGAYPDWHAYQEWIGRQWAWGVSSHPYEAMDLKVTEGNPLGFGWASGWLPVDEVFIDLQTTASVVVGMTGRITTGEFPVAWFNEARPNIACWMPGHRRDSWAVPAMRQGLGEMLAGLLKQSRTRLRGW
jgi:predicted dehydrogenase/type 1 glutamine amidotransferase